MPSRDNLGDGAIVGIEENVSQDLRAALAPVDALTDRHRRLAGYRYSPGSKAEEDIRTSPRLGDEGRMLVDDLLETSLDHLLAWRHLLASGRHPASAHLTLIRASLEASVAVRWLLDPAVSSGERVGRATG